MHKQPYPYCAHGVYTGGCGADYLCPACEDGEEEPDAAEQQAYVHMLYTHAAQRHAELLHLLSQLDVISIGVITIARAELSKDMRNLGQEVRLLAEIRKWSDGEHDRSWLDKRHKLAREVWDQTDAEMQFWSLPEQVLDGP